LTLHVIEVRHIQKELISFQNTPLASWYLEVATKERSVCLQVREVQAASASAANAGPGSGGSMPAGVQVESIVIMTSLNPSE
jgi:hypothetical protein